MRFFKSPTHGYLVLDGNRYDFGPYITATIYDLRKSYGFSCDNPEEFLLSNSHVLTELTIYELTDILTKESHELLEFINDNQVETSV